MDIVNLGGSGCTGHPLATDEEWTQQFEEVRNCAASPPGETLKPEEQSEEFYRKKTFSPDFWP
jgi:hypothetical protein